MCKWNFFSLPFWLQVTTTIMRIDARALTHSHADRVSERKSKHEMAKVASKYRRYGDEMRSASERDTTCRVHENSVCIIFIDFISIYAVHTIKSKVKHYCFGTSNALNHMVLCQYVFTCECVRAIFWWFFSALLLAFIPLKPFTLGSFTFFVFLFSIKNFRVVCDAFQADSGNTYEHYENETSAREKKPKRRRKKSS